MEWAFWAMVGAAVVHVTEEYLFGWLDFTRDPDGRYAAGLDLTAFVVFNALFMGPCAAEALVGMKQPFFSLSIAALFLINAIMRVVPVVAVRRYSPGAVSAGFLCVPLAIYAFYVVGGAGELSALTVLGAFLPGFPWMAFPAGASFIRSARRGDWRRGRPAQPSLIGCRRIRAIAGLSRDRCIKRPVEYHLM